MHLPLSECYRTFYDLMYSRITCSDIPWALLRCCVFHVFLFQYLLTTNKINLPGKCRYLVCYILHYPKSCLYNWSMIRDVTILDKVKRPKSLLACPLICALFIKHNIETMATGLSRCMHRASYCSVFISRPNRCTESYNVFIFINKCSTCFGLFSPTSGATFLRCILQLV